MGTIHERNITLPLVDTNDRRDSEVDVHEGFGLRHKAYLRVFVSRSAQRFEWLPPTVTFLHARLILEASSETKDLSQQIDAQCQSDAAQASYSGVPIKFYSDAAWAYHENMMGEKPLIYLCGSSCPTCGMHPQFATVDVYEASSHEQGEDNIVLTAPLNGEIWSLADAFAIRWHRPQVTKKRKRKNWAEDNRKKGRI